MILNDRLHKDKLRTKHKRLVCRILKGVGALCISLYISIHLTHNLNIQKEFIYGSRKLKHLDIQRYYW